MNNNPVCQSGNHHKRPCRPSWEGVRWIFATAVLVVTWVVCTWLDISSGGLGFTAQFVSKGYQTCLGFIAGVLVMHVRQSGKRP